MSYSFVTFNLHSAFIDLDRPKKTEWLSSSVSDSVTTLFDLQLWMEKSCWSSTTNIQVLYSGPLLQDPRKQIEICSKTEYSSWPK